MGIMLPGDLAGLLKLTDVVLGMLVDQAIGVVLG
jgi:hypothetical protein